MRERIFIGICAYGMVSAETLEDYMRMSYHFGRRYPEYDFFLGIKTKSEQFRARNALVESAITIGADWLLMLDDDHIIETENSSGNPLTGADAYNFLRKLLEHDVDIVGPLYWQRGGSARPVVMDNDETGMPEFVKEYELGSGLEERDVQGGGCMLIKMRVFDKVDAPYFAPEFEWGTDIQLCRKAKEKGFKVYNDPSIEIGHVMQQRVIITRENKDQYKTKDPALMDFTKDVEWKTDGMMFKMRYDAAEFLGIPENEIEKRFNDLKEGYSLQAELLSRQYGEGTREYYAHMGPEQLVRQVLFHHTAPCRKVMSMLLNEIKPLNRVGMDFGCGSAPVGFELAKRGGEMYFVDVDGATAYEFTKWRCKKYDLTNAHFCWPEPDTLDYCLALDSIEHISEWKPVVRRIIDSLKVGGILVSNFMRIADSLNPEHINMDKPGFMAFLVDNGMLINSDSSFTKISDRG